ILLGTGTGSFGAATNFAVGTTPESVAVGDFNGDGKQDVATANTNSNNISILLGTATGSFGAATNFAVGTNPVSVVVGDFNGDGKQDLAVANGASNNVSILLGTTLGKWSVVSSTLSDGAHILKANATDTAGNTGPNSASITVTVDTQAPTVSITSPSNNTSTSAAAIPVSGTASDNVAVSSVTWKVDSGSVSTATGTTSWSFTTGTRSDGSHTIRVNATDTAGNVA